MKLNRRILLKSAAGGLALAAPGLIGVRSARAAGVVNVLGNPNVLPEGFKEAFEKKTGITINFRVADEGNKVFALVTAERENPTIDVVQMIGARYLPYMQADLLEYLDKSKVAGWDNIHPFYQDHQLVKYQDRLVGVPLSLGYTGVAHNTDYLPTVDSWEALWDEKHGGKIGIRLAEFIPQVFLYWGRDPNMLDFKDNEEGARKVVNEARDFLISKKPLWRQFWSSPGEIQQLLIDDEVKLTNSVVAFVSKLIADGMPLRVAVPKEGAIVYSYSWSIIKNAKNQDNAYTFMSEYLQYPGMASAMTRSMGLMSLLKNPEADLTANERAAFLVPEELFPRFKYLDEGNGTMRRKLMDEAAAYIRSA